MYITCKKESLLPSIDILVCQYDLQGNNGAYQRLRALRLDSDVDHRGDQQTKT